MSITLMKLTTTQNPRKKPNSYRGWTSLNMLAKNDAPVVTEVTSMLLFNARGEESIAMGAGEQCLSKLRSLAVAFSCSFSSS